MTAATKKSMSRSTRIAVQVVAVAAIGAVVIGFLEFRSYVQESPRFCQSCHSIAPELAIWTESEHRNVRCQACHHQSMQDGLRVISAYVSGRSTDERHAPVDLGSCAGCHASHDTGWPTVSASVGHRVHARDQEIDCTVCHGRQMHFDQPTRATCEGCHENETLGTAHETEHCLACHNFLSEGELNRPMRSACLRCHEARDWPIKISNIAPMQFACYACHRPHVDHGETNPFVACIECHKQAELSGLHGVPDHADCSGCHAPHDWVPTRDQCFECHEGLASHHPGERCSRCHSFERGIQKGP